MNTLEPAENLHKQPYLTVSIVTFQPDQTMLKTTLQSLALALEQLAEKTAKIILIQNSNEVETAALANQILGADKVNILCGQGNIGFGRGHNLALPHIGRYHLILNPDIEMHKDALNQAIDFMDGNQECGLVSPHAVWPDGKRQYLCKRYPALFDLILRGFAPSFIRRAFSARLAKYEMHKETSDDVIVYWDPPIVSGCFMLFRGSVIQQLKGFNPKFFLYFEDFDLSLRTSLVSRIAYTGNVRIKHAGGHAAKKGLRHIKLFAISALQFYHLHGIRLI